MQQLQKFIDLGLSESAIASIQAKGFLEPTAIQAAAIPLLLQDEIDVVGKAQTGTGKTAAFGLPILEIVDPSFNKVQALILLPTRELAVQVATEIDSLKGKKKLEVLSVYGGSSIDLQMRRLNKVVHVVVGTPGRVLDHLRRNTLDLSHLKFVVLDEADEMLNMGFIEDVETILAQAPSKRRTMLFSATMPQPILNLAKNYMGSYKLIEVNEKELTPSLTKQYYYEVKEGDKFELLCRLIDLEPNFYALIFCRTKMQSDEVGQNLIDKGYNAEVIHGDLAQRQRELILHKLRTRKINILVATDVAARGIDIQDLSHVINYTIPQNPESYVHRIGRTGRAGKEGVAVTFVTPSETRRFTYIKRMVANDVVKEQIPSVEKVIAAKKKRILKTFSKDIKGETDPLYLNMAYEISEDQNPIELLAKLLEKEYGNQLSPTSYKSIRDITPSTKRDENYEVRLFIARGRSSGMTKKLLVDYIKENAKVTDRELDDVQVLQDFSFVTTPNDSANKIIKAFSKLSQGGRPIVTKAKPDNPNSKHLTSAKKDNFNKKEKRKSSSQKRDRRGRRRR